MKIIAFDSTAKAASVAVTEDEKLLALYTVDNGLTQSELLLPMAESILKSLQLTFDDIELFTCCTGPGSFTGVRIGVSLVKGLAFAKERPVVSVSTIEALAYNLSSLNGIIVPCMDARRSQVYTAIFRSSGGVIRRLTEDDAIPLSKLADLLGEYEGEPIYITGDGYDVAMKALLQYGVVLCETPYLLRNENAYSCAVVAYKNYLSGKAVSDLDIAPTYLRLPQAERERLERIKQNNETKDGN